MQNFKHKYLQYFLLALLAFKGLLYVAENVSICIDQDTTCLVELSDLENDKDEDEKELEEVKKHNTPTISIVVTSQFYLSNNNFSKAENYKPNYLEFTTPPPEVA